MCYHASPKALNSVNLTSKVLFNNMNLNLDTSENSGNCLKFKKRQL